MQTILLLEDDPNLGLILSEHLQMNGFDVQLCTDGEAGTTAFDNGKFDLCLVDIMLPKKDGFAFAREVRRKDNEIPLIFLTAKGLKEDRIEGFKIGCDDYITKPFSVEELLLRIRAVLRRSAGAADDDTTTEFEIGSYSFNSAKRILRRNKTEIKLTPKESELLTLLCLHKNRTLERTVALSKIWGKEDYFSSRSMDVFVTKLRHHLSRDSNVEIVGIHGKGLRLTVE